jgi:hypothetical protein
MSLTVQRTSDVATWLIQNHSEKLGLSAHGHFEVFRAFEKKWFMRMFRTKRLKVTG